jgi:hypothetical protein
MIDEKKLEAINQKMEAKKTILHILRGFESPYVETTIGLVAVNSASKHKTTESDDADWLHQNCPRIEAELKERARAILEREIAEIDAWLSERIVG